MRYLQAGTLFVVSGDAAHDVLAAEANYIGPLAALTDGEWVWHSDLAYYVERYHVPLDECFVKRVRHLKGVPPTVSHADLIALEEVMIGDTGEDCAAAP